MKIMLLGLLLALPLMAGSQSTFPVQPKPTAPKEFFVGCRPSAGECVNSCATRKARWELNKKVCDFEANPFDKLVCICLLH